MGEISKIAQDYFSYMARAFPVMCACDEFYSFPRAAESARYPEILDSLDENKIETHLAYIKDLKHSLERLSRSDIDFESHIDYTILKQSILTFLRDFGELKLWQLDPSMYLKIMFLGVDQILSKAAFMDIDAGRALKGRIAQIPRLLEEAKKNLKSVPGAYMDVAKKMVDESMRYFKNADFKAKCKGMEEPVKQALRSLRDFKGFLIRHPSHRLPFIMDRDFLGSILRDSFSYKSGLEEIFEIAHAEYRRILKQLARLARESRPSRRWQDMLSGYGADIKDTKTLLSLYSGQITALKSFIIDREIVTIPQTHKVELRLTPGFMRPIRASASYSSPLTGDKREPAFFFIMPDLAKGKSLHGEYIYVTAHETYPGHHLLDCARRRISNPVRRQIESPLFYEGWASYAERLIYDEGYIKDPMQKMVGLKRRAWRTVRAMLDVGMRTKRMKSEDAEALLRGLGYSGRIADLMLRHYMLSPGYQLCYTIGELEFNKLKKAFSLKLGLKNFHDLILQGGQMPFDMLEKRLRKESCGKNF